MGIEIIDLFLPQEEFSQIQDLMSGAHFPWYWNDMILGNSEKNHNPNLYQFCHGFLNDGEVLSTKFLPMWINTCKLLNTTKIHRIKANLNPGTLEPEGGGMHIDYDLDIKTSLLYINTNNGGTRFECGRFVESVANRMVIFNAQMMHEGITCTDEKRKIVVNFNYE